MPAGAPRTVCPPPDEMIELGKQMVQWIKDNPQCLHVSAWYSCEMFITRNTWDQMIEKKEFQPYYEMALSIIAQKYLDKDSNVREGVSQRWQRSYFRDLKKIEDQDKQDDIMRQKELASSVEEDVLKNTQAMNDQLAEARILLEKAQQVAKEASENHSEKSEQA